MCQGLGLGQSKEEITNEWQKEGLWVVEGLWLLTLVFKSVLGRGVKEPEYDLNNARCMLI